PAALLFGAPESEDPKTQSKPISVAQISEHNPFIANLVCYGVPETIVTFKKLPRKVSVPSGRCERIAFSGLRRGLREGVHGLCELGISTLDGHFRFEYLAPQGFFDVLL
ncbi:MAG: hypothetical protein QOE55_8052, partial [Acidobacteriaceae bacterium]|nr:hypothetical protein [Acidobacteriaceae bacterium]